MLDTPALIVLRNEATMAALRLHDDSTKNTGEVRVNAADLLELLNMAEGHNGNRYREMTVECGVCGNSTTRKLVL